jgi:ribosomal protein L34
VARAGGSSLAELRALRALAHGTAPLAPRVECPERAKRVEGRTAKWEDSRAPVDSFRAKSHFRSRFSARSGKIVAEGRRKGARSWLPIVHGSLNLCFAAETRQQSDRKALSPVRGAA